MSETFRAFVAIDLPDSVRSALGKTQETFKAYGFRVKWVRPESIHLTLKFLGNVNAAQSDAIVEAMTVATKGCTALSLAPCGIGVFPHARRPRVIWAGLSGQLDLLKSLQQNLEVQLAELSFPKDSRPFKGHLTLGRVKGKIAAHRMREALDQLEKFESETFEVNQIILFKSQLQPGRAVYTKVARVQFGLNIGD